MMYGIQKFEFPQLVVQITLTEQSITFIGWDQGLAPHFLPTEKYNLYEYCAVKCYLSMLINDVIVRWKAPLL